MEMHLLMCLAAATLLPVCHGCSTGKGFITTFLPNYQESAFWQRFFYENDHKLEVVLTALGSAADVHIQVASVDFSTKLTLSAGETRWVRLPLGAELQQQLVNQKSAVRISSSADISVVSFNRRHKTGDGTVVSPTTALGTEYLVFTPRGGSSDMDKLLAIVNGESPNPITILPSADVRLRGGGRWQSGKPVIFTLAPYASYLIKSHNTWTGLVRSKYAMAIIAGHQCLSMGSGCEHVYEQLPPVASLGKDYMVPRTGSCRATNWAVIVAAEDNTELTLHRGHRSAHKQTLKTAGLVSFQKLINKHPLVVKSNKKVMALLLSNNKPHDPFLMSLTPTSKLSNDWAVETVDGLSNTVAILSEREGSSSVKVCLKGHCLSPRWNNLISDQQWVWSNVAVGAEQSHVTVEGDARIAVYVYGGKSRHAYGTAGVCSAGTPPPTLPKDPCEDVKCRQMEDCVDGRCVHVSTATCHALGDPHYLTFDGRSYDFQGSCTYIMATVEEKAPGLLPFTVSTKNNHRGNRRVSFVRTITVTVHGHTIIIGRHRKQVQVNGELQYLPVILLDGKISVKYSGMYAVLRTDFGLTVKYDWNMRLYVTVPSSYYNHLGGLCGNYNGDKTDDLPEPKGSRLSAVLKMIQQWKIKDPDPFCHDNCGGRCPTCSPEKQAYFRHPKQCGILTQADGPFSSCHKVVNPSLYVDNCVYDVCINKGARQILCENLKSYNDACLSEGGKVKPEWRMVSKCPLSCPAGSHYEACGSACPASCGITDNEKQCAAPCGEGCQCDAGLVLNGDRCVPQSSCGCRHQGKYYPSDTAFWADSTCTTRCQCNSGNVKCTSVTCKKKEHCALKGGVRDCYPVSYATCQAAGDPHYRSFDNRRFDFQGTCTYVLSQHTEGSNQGLLPFQVLVQNENRGRNKQVSYAKSVSLTVLGYTVSMSRVDQGNILVNSRSINLPYITEDGMLSIFRQGYFGIVKTNFGLTLKFNWNSHVSLTLPSSYSSATSGLCGNYNGKPGDDMLQPDGTQAKHVNAFGHSWKAGGDSGCMSDCPDNKCPECEPALLLRYQQGRYCGRIADKSGPFGKCHNKVDHSGFLKDCVFDLCMYQGHATALCNSLSAFSTSCQEAGATVETWRSEEFCPPLCGTNSHYEVCAPTCQLTCSGLTPPDGCDESAPCTEGCVCDDGFALSHDKCVPLTECGCQYEGQYYQRGQVFYPRESCNTQCVCGDNGQVQCNPEFRCSHHEKCVVTNGVASCTPKSVASCSVFGVGSVLSFDGKAYPLLGNCLFKLSEVEAGENMAPFSVLLHQVSDKDGYFSRSVELQVYDIEITMETGIVWEIKVDGIRVSLPASLADGNVQAYQNGINIIIETDFDLKLTYDAVAGIVLQIPSTYQGLPSGLCGNYNGQSSDDPASEEAKPGSTSDFIVEKDDVTCETGCGDTSCPDPNGQKTPEAEKACDIIRARQGPFSGCHATVSPVPHFDACVREMSSGEKDQEVLCRHIQNYVGACQLAGTKINRWRSDTFCPLKCRAGSHYELCSSSCSSTCASLERSAPCPVCQEGCQCDDGLTSDGDRCVPVEQCGCVVDGHYYKSNTPILKEDCSEHCVCQSGQFICKPTSCQEGEECTTKDGIMGCFSTDPCAEVVCRAKEHCEVSEGQGVCVPDATVLCWAFGDPHYTTFDGWSFSFQGTCSYVLVNTTGADPSLPEVTVTTKNELRGNSEGSFVRSASVELLGRTISIPRDERGFVLVDNIKTGLPVFLDGGSISITESGVRGILMSDIGVTVTFDWSTLVMVSLSSSYYGNVAGLCGNYNGNKDDEMTIHGGATAVNVTEWAGTWSVPDGDPFCYHYCDGVCPRCSEEDRLRYTGPQFCGILGNKEGPFSRCHASVPVGEPMSDCLYDVCVNAGRHEVLCESLSNYLAECQEAGATMLPWRQLANCTIECPANSHYEVCGPACPASCGAQPEVCHKACVEGCFCDQGYVLSRNGCVEKEKGCGCNHDGYYYLPGEVFWADSKCKEQCVCDAATQTVQCKPKGCQTGERCQVVDGVQDCYPISFKTCSARGDPHFYTFDGLKFDFQGNCVYRLATVCKNADGLQHFEVNLENNNRGNKRVSYAKVVIVKVFGNTYKFSVDSPYKVLVDGLKNSLPFSSNQSLVQVYRRYRLAVLETTFLKVSFNFASAVRVELATSYHGTTCGLCGNFNDNPADDLTLPNGTPASNANEFGVNQWVSNRPGCSQECKDCAQPPDPDMKPPSYTSVCDIITAEDGPLADCIGRVDSKQFREDCVYDMMLTDGKQEAACDIISDYVEECQLKGGCVKSWRTRQLCWMQCPANSMYSVTAPGCPLTCTSLSAPVECKTPPSEGCMCIPGYFLSQGRCMPLAECGCRFRGHYIESDEAFKPDCHQLCACQGGVVSCRRMPCRKPQMCGVVEGSLGCYDIRQLSLSHREKK
ncbi:IgGFc-binding protein-like [Hippocampus zosterae]|uniref:IgGFc-binding protein-like n=1 Tax=Hippocampus zosterae TaxID=109293 RepID=UPI00223D2EA5|nr:IgGFc-binding protein-like [Hippocampus zosterae]